MNQNTNHAAFQRALLKVAAIDGVASLLLGLGLYGKFAAKGNAFHPLLNDANTVNALLVLGGLGMMWGAYQVMTLRRQKP